MSKVSKVTHHHHNQKTHHKDVKKGNYQVVKGSQKSNSHVESDTKTNKLSEQILRAKEWTSAANVERIITKYGEEKFDRMIMASENIAKLSDDLGLTNGEIFKIARYIETKLKQKVKKGKAYLRKDKTGLARTIEYKSKRAFIHLKSHGVAPLGSGCHKRVTRSIMYAAHAPELVANSVGDKTVKAEGKVLLKLQGQEGIAKTYAVNDHKKKSGKTVYSIISKLYNAHTVRSYEYNRSSMENRAEEVYIARDLMKGLEGMHAKKLAHRDLHSGNFMVHRTENIETGKVDVTAALIDFGQVMTFKKTKKMVPKVEVAGQLVTPESLVKGKHRVDIRKIEAYAVGCSLYHLYFGSGPEWCEKMKQYRVRKLSSKKKKSVSHELVKLIRENLDKRKAEIARGEHKHKKFGKIIFKLLDPNPKKRLSPRAARKMFEQVIARLEAKKS